MKIRLRMVDGASVTLDGIRLRVIERGRRYAEEHPEAVIRAELWLEREGEDMQILEFCEMPGDMEPQWSQEYDVPGDFQWKPAVAPLLPHHDLVITHHGRET